MPQFLEIKPLYMSMREKHVSVEQFDFTYSKVRFKVCFAIDRKPFELMFGCVGRADCAFVLKMYGGFNLETIPDDAFYTLCRILNLRCKNGEFTSLMFLKHVAQNLPTTSKGNKELQPHEIAACRNDIPEGDKIYFVGWKPYKLGGAFHARNFEKTRKLCGDAAADFCIRNNISSCWSSVPTTAVPYCTPFEPK